MSDNTDKPVEGLMPGPDDRKPRAELRMPMGVWLDGYSAGEAGQPSDRSLSPSSREAWAWSAGWIDGNAARQQS